jgi:hypothetical protein
MRNGILFRYLALISCLGCADACEGSLPLGGDFAAVTISRSDPARIYTAVNQVDRGMGIYGSDDGGATFRKTPANYWDAPPTGSDRTPLAVTALAVHPTDRDRLLLLNAAGAVYLSTDAGRTWTATASVATPMWQQNRLLVHPSQPDRVLSLSGGALWLSTDGGRSFAAQASLAPPACQPGVCTDLAMDERTPDRLYAACKDGLAVSDNAGLCFTHSDAGGLRPLVLVTSPLAKDRLWAATEDGVYRSLDGGATFSRLADWAPVFGWDNVPKDPRKPLPTTLTVDRGLYVLAAQGPRLLFGTAALGVIGVGDADGQLVDLGAPLIRRGGAIQDLALAADGRIFLASGRLCGGRAGVFTSADGGASWSDALTAPRSPLPSGPYSPGSRLLIKFFRDVSSEQQQQIFSDRGLLPEPVVVGFGRWQLTPDAQHSTASLVQELGSLPEVECVIVTVG